MGKREESHTSYFCIKHKKLLEGTESLSQARSLDHRDAL